MTHPTEDRLRAYMDGELPLAEDADVGDHLGMCADCSAAAAEMRETADVFAGAMARMDAAEPEHWQALTGDAQSGSSIAGESELDEERTLRLVLSDPSRRAERDDLIRAATSGPALVKSGRVRRRGRSFAAPAMRWAAGIALTVAIGGSAAIASGLLRVGPQPETTVTTAPPSDAVAPAGGGVFGRPVNGAMEVVLTRAPSGSRVVIDWTDAEEVLVEVTGVPEARVIHRDGEERMVANLADRAGVVRVTMPRGLRSATVVWQGRIVVQVAEGTVSPEGAAAEGVVLEAQR